MISYELAVQLKTSGFPQKRRDHSKYYINEHTISEFEDIKNAFESETYLLDGTENIANWLDNFTYIPDLIDFMGINIYKETLKNYAEEWIKNKEIPTSQS